MNNPFYFTDRALKIEFNITLDSHHNNHAFSELTITPTFPEFGNGFLYIKKIPKNSYHPCYIIKIIYI